MAVIIQGGTGSGFRAAVTEDSRLKVETEGITLSGTINAGSQTWVQNFGDLGSNITGSVAITTNPLPISGSISTTQLTSSIDTGSIGTLTSGNNTLLLEHTIPTGSTYNLVGLDLTGTADGKFTLNHNSTFITQYRTNAAEQNVHRGYGNPIAFAAGSLTIFVAQEELLSQGFNGIMIGYETS